MYMSGLSECGCKRGMSGLSDWTDIIGTVADAYTGMPISSLVKGAGGGGPGGGAPAGPGTMSDQLTNLIANINANTNSNANISANTNVVSPNISSQNSANIAPSINPTFVMQTNPNNSGVSPYVSAGSQGPSFTGPSQTANPYVTPTVTATPVASTSITQPIGNVPATGNLPGFDNASGYIPGLPGTPAYDPFAGLTLPAPNNHLLLYGGLGILAVYLLTRKGHAAHHIHHRR